MLTTLAQNLKLLKPERERIREKNQRTGDGTLQITDEKELALYLDPWEESLLNFVMSHIYGIQQIDSVDEETLLLFTSKTDKACLRDLFDSHCFIKIDQL